MQPLFQIHVTLQGSKVEFKLETDPKNPEKKVAVDVTGVDGAECEPRVKGKGKRSKGKGKRSKDGEDGSDSEGDEEERPRKGKGKKGKGRELGWRTFWARI